MSLLMKALEKAAKDRGETKSEAKAPAPPAAASGAELALEPAHDPAAVLRLTMESESEPEPPAHPASGARASAAPGAEQLRAATVVQAGARSSAAASAGGNRSRMLVVFGTLAALVALGFGAYVYLQITNPALFLPKPPAAPGPLATAPVPPVQPAPPSQPLPTASILQSGAQEPPEASTAAPAAAPAATPAAKPAASAPAAPATAGNRIVVSRGSAEPKLNPLLTDAYASLEAGSLDAARRQYDQLLKSDPRNIDALLGLAAVATQENRTEEATRLYLRILDLDPRHALAQTGLIALLGRADPLSAESRLKQLIAREPSPFLYFTLGNLYADQSQWPQAQHAYFQAHNLEPANPDYAFNLAIGLEHLGQAKLALGFYQRAVKLAAARGRANFNVPQAQDRISKLAAQVE